jgi:hypothetical protein
MTEERNHKSTLPLNEKSLERLRRLKAKMTKIDDVGIIALALRGLEEKTDSIIRKRVKKKIMALKNEGLDPGQIADFLNSKGYPCIEGKHQWHGESISIMLNKKVSEVL